MLEFPYLPEPLPSPPPASVSAQATSRWRPLVPVRVHGPAGVSRFFPRALLDSGSDDTVFPLDTAARVGANPQPDTRYKLRWRGQSYPIQFASVELELTDAPIVWRWPAVIAFSAAPIRYPLLGQAGCLGFMDVTFFGARRLVRLETSATYPGTVATSP